LFSGQFQFREHIDELRRRLRTVAISFLIIFIALILFPANPSNAVQNPGQYLSLAFISNTLIANFLTRMIHDLLPAGWTLLAARGIGEPMEIYLVGALILSLALDMPIIAYETYKFIDPALSKKERDLIYPFVTSTSVLFVVGLLFGYFILAKFLIIALAPFFTSAQVSFQIDAAAFYYVVFLIIGATGVSFTSPVFVYTLIRLRVLKADFFSKNRVIIWFVTWVVTGLFLTPDGGPLLDVIIFIPIVAMIEIAVALGRRSVKDKEPLSEPKKGYTCPSCGHGMKTPMLFCERCGRSVA
jgi:Sec-independent protein secretion pathway component TatC